LFATTVPFRVTPLRTTFVAEPVVATGISGVAKLANGELDVVVPTELLATTL
jgi:hypothetical protein